MYDVIPNDVIGSIRSMCYDVMVMYIMCDDVVVM